MAVAELVPQIAVGVRFAVCAFECRSSGDRFEHQEMGGLRFVPAGEEAVDGGDVTFGGDDQVGPAARRVHGAVGVARGFEGSYDGGPDGDDPATGLVYGVEMG